MHTSKRGHAHQLARVPSASPEAAASTVGHAPHATVVDAVRGKGSARFSLSCFAGRRIRQNCEGVQPRSCCLSCPNVRRMDSQAVGDVTKACLVYHLFAIMASPSCAAKHERSHHSHLLQAPAAAH